ncbi:MAG: hypothetical protein P8185_17460 [Deltaproteobacteria bacterium]|jgi:hypothetical protein
MTGKAGKDKWILAEARPESVPVWCGVRKKEAVDENVSKEKQGGDVKIFKLAGNRPRQNNWGRLILKSAPIPVRAR